MGFSFLGAVGWTGLAGLLAAAAFVLRRAVPAQRGLRVLARLSLEPRRSIHIVEVAGRVLVLSSSESGLGLLTELDPGAASQLLAETPPGTSLLAGLFATERRA